LLFLPSRAINGHDRNPVRRKEMNSTTDLEKNASAPEVSQPKTRRTKKAQAAEKAGPAKNQAKKQKAAGVNKKAEAITLMKHSKGVTLAKIIAGQLARARAALLPQRSCLSGLRANVRTLVCTVLAFKYGNRQNARRASNRAASGERSNHGSREHGAWSRKTSRSASEVDVRSQTPRKTAGE
jgi:hypothetical protein